MDLLTDVLVRKFVRKTDLLRLVLDRLSINNGDLELINNGFVDLITL